MISYNPCLCQMHVHYQMVDHALLDPGGREAVLRLQGMETKGS
jgi:hypothetical protein